MTTMSRPFRLETVSELAQKNTEKATQGVGRLMNTREAVTQKPALLSSYRNSYHQQMPGTAEGGMDVTRLRNYAAFVNRLSSATHQQKGAINTLEQQLAMSRVN